jgi:hypothetical protein
MEVEQVGRESDQALSREMIFLNWYKNLKKKGIPGAVLEELSDQQEEKLFALLYLVYSSPKHTCLKCNTGKQLTDHHLFPKRHFRNGNGNRIVLCLCAKCHPKLEKIIEYRLQPAVYYIETVWNYLCEGRAQWEQ